MATRPDSTIDLTDAEKRDLVALIQAGKPLPEKYRFILFEDKREVELVWNGKTRDVCTTVLPFQTLEHVDEPRREAPASPQFDLFDARGRQTKGWTNKLIWGDNKLILSSLKSGPLREQIEEAGGLRLIYIDPPFDVGADFSMDIEIGGETFHKEPNILEQIAYRDTWGRGADSFISMIYERLILMRDLLAEDGSIYVHMGWGVSHYVRGLLDEVFGKDRAVNQIIWKRQTAHSDSGQGSQHLGRVHDVILLYTRAEQGTWNLQYTDYDAEYLRTHYKGVEEASGRRFELADLNAPGGAGKGNPRYEFLGVTRFWRFKQERMQKLYEEGRIIQPSPGAVPRYKRYLDEMPGVPVQDLWLTVNPINSQAKESAGYATRKPEALLERIIKASSNEGDLVADFFVGSGTTAAVAEKPGRKWIATDLGKFGIHTTRVCAGGQLYKVSKSKAGVVSRDKLTKAWTDWVDYWAVDFDYGSRKEIVKRPRSLALHASLVAPSQSELVEWEEWWTGGYMFENEWQSFRTRQDRTLELKSVAHAYARPERYQVAVKVIDVCGNDTMTLVPVNVG